MSRALAQELMNKKLFSIMKGQQRLEKLKPSLNLPNFTKKEEFLL